MSHPGRRYSTRILLSWVEECIPAIPELKRHRQEDHRQSEASLIYIMKCRPVRDIQHNSASKTKSKKYTQGFSTQISCSKERCQVVQEEKNQYLEL